MTVTSDYMIWKAVLRDSFCVCTTLEGFDSSYKLLRGDSVAAEFPDDAFFRMDPDYPKDIKLSDNIENRSGLILASARLKERLAAESSEVEYLPVRILNHKERIASADYCIVNPLAVYDALDLDNSIVKWNRINPSVISTVSKLVIDSDRIPANATLFRLKAFESRIVVQRALAEKLMGGGFTGLGFTDAARFSGF